jgi:1,2-diacylglycerol 3-alpha-glucosyltransferase
LVHGFAQLVELTDIPVKLVIVGSGPAVNELEVLVHSYHLQDRVVFTGKAPQAETQNYYQLATIFASASLSETQGLTYLEAMAGGKPLLWRYDRNLDEMLIDQRHGYIFTDAVDFAAKALKLLQQTPEQVETMRAACLKRAEDFSAETFYQKVLEVYQRAVRKKW